MGLEICILSAQLSLVTGDTLKRQLFIRFQIICAQDGVPYVLRVQVQYVHTILYLYMLYLVLSSHFTRTLVVR